MSARYFIFCLSMTIVMAEPPVFMGLQHQNERVLPLSVHDATTPHVYQHLPQEHSFADFLLPPVTYGVPAVSASHDIKSNEFRVPLEDSYNTAFFHSSSQHHQTGYNNGPTETQVHKHIYVHVPPKDYDKEDDVQPRVIHQAGPKQKHYKIVFIKAPEAPSIRTPIVPPLPQNEEKTLIYVLHKKPETYPDLVIPTPQPTKPSKPEVFFIKYLNKRQEAPVYGPPTSFNEIQSRQADDGNSNAEDEFMPSLHFQQNEMESTTSLPQYDEKIEQEEAQPKFVTESSSATVSDTDFYNASTENNSINEDVQATTAGPINQYLPPESTLAPTVVKSMDENAHLPATFYGAPRLNRFFIKRRK